MPSYDRHGPGEHSELSTCACLRCGYVPQAVILYRFVHIVRKGYQIESIRPGVQ